MFKQDVVIGECRLVLGLCAQQGGTIETRTRIEGREFECAGIAREGSCWMSGAFLGDAEVGPQWVFCRRAGDAVFEQRASGINFIAVGQYMGQ